VLNRIRGLVERQVLPAMSPKVISHFLRSLPQDNRLQIMLDLVDAWSELGADDVLLETLMEVTGVKA